MFSKTNKELLETSVHSETNNNGQPSKIPRRLRKVVRIAVAIRKFQKLESNRFKRSIDCEFDKTVAINQLKRSYEQGKFIHLEQCKKFAYHIRKFKITFDELKKIDGKLLSQFSKYLRNLDGNTNEQVHYFLCLSLKYLTRNSKELANEIQYSVVIDLIKRCQNESVKTELVYTLAYMTEKSTLSSELITELSSLMVNRFDISEEAKGFLLARLEIGKSQCANDQLITEHRFTSTSKSHGNNKMNKLVVTKTIQTVKSNYNHKESEETKMMLFNLSNGVKNRQRVLNTKITIDQINTVNDTVGDDRSIWRSTWPECLHLYTLVIAQGQTLKSGDKDNYLPNKLFGLHYYFKKITKNNARIYSFFINQMIVAVLFRTSKKQQLNRNAINKLMMCVTDLDSLALLALGCKDDIVNLFVNSICNNYDEYKALSEPDLASNLIKTIINKTIEIVTVKRWFWNSQEKRLKRFDKHEIEELIKNEISQLRLNSLNAIYNCSIRDKRILTKDRIKKIQNCVTNYDENDSRFIKLIFQIMSIADSTNEIDYKGTFNAYINLLQRGISGNTEMIIIFLNNQAKDAKRSQELFTDEALTKLIDLLNHTMHNDQIKEDIIEIINNFLEHDTSKALDDRHLESLIEYILHSDNSNTSIINSVLTTIMIIAEKFKSLSKRIVRKLMDNIECFGENSSNYVLIILSHVIHAPNPLNETDLEKICSKLDSTDVVVLNSESKITFTQRTDENQHCDHISLLTANLILLSTKNEIPISYKTISNLMSALNNHDKQTRIISSKCIDHLSKYIHLENDTLSQMKDFLNDQVYDVSVYILSAYSNGLRKLAGQLDTPIDGIHMDNLSSLFLTQDLRLNQINYAERININLLGILKIEAEKQTFKDNDIFTLFDSILSLNEKYSTDILEILEIYTQRYTIPVSTIRAVENALAFPEQFEKAFLIFHNVIHNGQPVANKMLQILTDNLYMAVYARRRYNSFKLLEQARQNQDLSENIFNKVELTKAGFILSRSTNKKSVMKFMQEQTSDGMQLPIDTVIALENEIHNEDALQVLYNISKNKQVIQYDLLNKLVSSFNPISDQHILIGIFENVAKNNQTLSSDLLKKLEKALNRQTIENKVLSIFVYLAQKGEKLRENIIQKILNRILPEKDIMLKQELLSALGSLIQTHSTDIELYKEKTENILINEINSDSVNLQKLCIYVLRVLVRFVSINSNLFDRVVTIGTNINCDRTIKNEIYSLFTSMETNTHNNQLASKYKAKIQLANLDYQSNNDLLNKLKAYTNHDGGLLEQNYQILKTILDQDFNLQEKVLEILQLSKSKDQITDDLIESIVLLYESTSSMAIMNSCSKLLDDINRSEKKLNARAMKIVDEKLRHDKANEIESLFSQSYLYKQLKVQFRLNDKQIKELFKILKIKTNILDIQTIDELIEISIEHDPFYYNNQAFVFLLEQVLLTNTNNQMALSCYCRIIKENKCEQVINILDKLVQTSNETLLLVESIYHALKSYHLSQRCITFLEINLYDNDRFIRSFSFKGLKIIDNNSEYKKSKRFHDWCDVTMKNLSEKNRIKIDDVQTYWDILDVIVSLDFIDLNVFKKNKKDVWTRELIVSSLFEYFKVFHTGQINFYSNWLIIQNQFTYQQSVEILSLINQRIKNFETITNIIDIFVCIRTRSHDYVKIILINHESPHDKFKHDYCIEMIKNRIENKNIDENYLNKLCQNVCTMFNIKFIENLFKCISRIDNLREFEDVIQFCSNKTPNLTDLCFEHTNTNQLKTLLQANHICNNVKSNGERQTDRDVLFYNLCLLIKKQWTFEQLNQLTESFNSSNSNRKLENYIDILKLIDQYNLPSSQCQKYYELIEKSNTFTELLKGLNRLVIENNFQLSGKVKNANELLNELAEINKNNSALVKYIKTELPKELEQIKQVDLKSLVIDNKDEKPIAKWDIKQINYWAEIVKSQQKQFTNVEVIAVIKQANLIFSGHHLTDTQILCSLIALQNQSNRRGKLLQVATGEGKSTIVCILAIIHALKDKQVHVITSSPVLAERDSNEKQKLFKMFYLTCSDNNDKAVYLHGQKDCYKADIVYGEVSQFQFDTLRDQYSMLGTLGDRTCEIAIIDEVDSMLIDDNSKIARLSSTAAGMDYFQVVYVYIWQRLLTIREKIIMFNNKMYMIYGKIGFDNGKIILEFTDNNNNLRKIPDLERCFAENKDVSSIAELIDDDLEKYLAKSLNEYLTSLNKDTKLEIPNNYKEFYETQKIKWIHNAIEAMNYQENIHYVVQEGQIKPVDYYSTGIVQSSTNWSDGLHQFLQIKHNLKMTSETFTTNFLSNIGFINNYKNIYGLTGTLGSEKAKKVLNKVYNVDLVNIAQLRQKQYLELEPIVAQDESKWAEQICSTVLTETKKDRGVLIICENIAHANRLGDLLKVRHRSTAIKLYTMNNMNQEKHVEKILPGEIIIATNLAGRGTDIKTDEIEEFGGLHVVLTFMPNNQRVEDQAFGRTARQGKRGTGLMILNSMNLIDFSRKNTTEVKLQRDEIESNVLDNFQNNELKLIQIKDKLFKNFCKFLNEDIRKHIRREQRYFDKGVNAVKSLFKHIMPTVYETNLIAAIEEQWAKFLRKLDDNIIELDQAEHECKKLIDSWKDDYDKKTIIKNPYYHIVIANDIIMREWSIKKSSKARHALEHYKKATELDGAFSGSGYLGIAWCTLVIQDTDYKNKALESFKKSLEIFSNEMALLNAMHLFLEKTQPTFTDSELYKQLTTKVTILGTYLNSIQSNINAIKKSLRLIDLIEIKEQSNDDVLEKIECHSECQRSDNNELEIKLDKKSKYSLIFNDLTWREDCGKIDQALDTMNTAYDNGIFSESYDGICITLKQTDLDTIKALFKQNKEYMDLTKESMIDTLKNQRTTWNYLRLTNSFLTDLKITHSDNTTEKLKSKQINELITLIETKTDDTLRFNATIKDANVNEVNKYFKTTASNSTSLQVDFNHLDCMSVYEKLSLIKAKSINIEMAAIKSTLLKIINREQYINIVKVYANDKKVYEKINRTELLKRLNEPKKDDSYFYIQFESLQVNQVKSIISDCQDMSFNVSFVDIDFYNSINGLNGQATFHFNNLNKKISKIIVNQLRQDHMEFSFEFHKLKEDQVEHIVAGASLEQENMQINKIKTLMELYMSGFIPTHELNEFAARGVEYMLEINEKRFVPWRSVIAVSVLASLQVLLGGALICTGFGATVGMSVITEGLADMFTAYRAFSNRQFNWTDYCKQKAVSLAISAISMGYSKLKDAGKGISNALGSASTEVIEQAGTRAVRNTRTITETVTRTGQSLKSLAVKYTTVKIGEAVVREGLNAGVQYLSHFSFDMIKPQISASVQTKIRLMFSKPQLIYLLRKMYALDLQTKSKSLQCKVDQIVADTINPRHDFARRQWDSIGMPLIKGILSASSNYGSIISMAFRIVGTLNGLYTLQVLIDNVEDELVKKLQQIDKNTMTMTLILHRNLKINKEHAQNAAVKLRTLNIIDENDNLKLKSYYDVEHYCSELKPLIDIFRSKEKDTNDIANFMQSFCDYYMHIDLNSFSTIMKSVADKITEQLIQIIESQLIQPWSTLAVSSLTSNLSNIIQDKYLVNKDQNSDSQNKDQKKYDQLKEKKVLTEEEKVFMRNYSKYRTFAEQINYNAKDYCIAYTQCEILYYAKNLSAAQNGKVDKDVQERADDVRTNKPASLAEMSLIEEKYGIKLKVVDDPNYQKTQDDIDNGVEIVYVEKGGKDSNNVDTVGHAYYIDANGNRINIKSAPNDCLYGVVSKILETKGVYVSVENMRNDLADTIESNGNYSLVMEAEQWIYDRYPQEANSLVFTAGLLLIRKDKTKEEQQRYEKLARKVKDKARYDRIIKKIDENEELTKKKEKLIEEKSKKEKLIEEKSAKGELTKQESDEVKLIKDKIKSIEEKLRKIELTKKDENILNGRIANQDPKMVKQIQDKIREKQTLNNDDKTFLAENAPKPNLTDDDECFLKDYIETAQSEHTELEVEPDDIVDVRESVFQKGERGKPHVQPFTDEVPKCTKETLPDHPSGSPVPRSTHHIFPNHLLKPMIPCKTDDVNDSKTKLKTYVNKPHIQAIIIQQNLANPENNHGDVIYASIANNPHNLVDGPSARTDDPRGGIDQRILNQQSPEYKTKFENLKNEPTLENLGNLPPTAAVNWEIKPTQGNKYSVASKSSEQ